MKTNLASTLRFIHTKNNFIKLLNFNYYNIPSEVFLPLLDAFLRIYIFQ